MLKKLSSMVFIGLCGVILTTTFVSSEEALKKERTLVGERSEPLETRMNQLQARAKMAVLNPEETSKEPSVDAKNDPQKLMKRLAPAAAKSLYYTTHPAAYQNPVAVSFFGDTVELMDGSVWGVAPSDAYKTVYWSPTDLVIITPNHSWFSAYAFRLTNQNTCESVEVNLHLGPIAPMYGSYYTHWIVAIDYYHNFVYLEDGSIWNMSSFDSQVVNQWVTGDVVIIGVNDGWLSSLKPNVLINVAMVNFAAGSVSF